MVNQERTSTFVALTCSCGRGLRAKSDLVGTEIRCWDCHKMVLVPLPNHGQRVARELSQNALEVIKGPGLNSVLAAAIVLTGVLCLPDYGGWGAVLVFAMGASAYGEIIQRVSRGPSEQARIPWSKVLIPRSILKLLLCVLMAAGTVFPLWILNAGVQRSPHLDWRGLSILGVTWCLAPLLMMIVYSQRTDGTTQPVRESLRLLARHPIAVLAALAVIPFTMILIEVGLDLIFYIPGNLPFFALDFMPMPQTPEKPVMYEGVPYYHLIDYRSYPDTKFIAGYFDGLKHGYSFVTAIPASLAVSSRAGMNPEVISSVPLVYGVARGLITLVIVTCLIASFAIQARWLGSIAALERKRPD